MKRGIKDMAVTNCQYNNSDISYWKNAFVYLKRNMLDCNRKQYTDNGLQYKNDWLELVHDQEIAWIIYWTNTRIFWSVIDEHKKTICRGWTKSKC